MTATASPLLAAAGLTRKYADMVAVDDLAISVARGQVLGLLGLNGAGKSSTLQMLAGVLAPQSGEIDINGHSLLRHPLIAKRHIGYLPEVAPVYPDMRVVDYLNFAARLRRVKRPHNRVNEVLTQLDLSAMAKRRIASLSKGYRQRVGIAQAIVHEPALIILDEPSSGLDPEQMRELRELIVELGSHSGVIFSSHLLSEVSEVCTDVAVLHRGRIIHRGALANESLPAFSRVKFSRAVNTSELERLSAVAQVNVINSHTYSIQRQHNGSSVIDAEQLLQALIEAGLPVAEFSPDQSSLENLFSALVRGEHQAADA